jgi:hypothetical protein
LYCWAVAGGFKPFIRVGVFSFLFFLLASVYPLKKNLQVYKANIFCSCWENF